MNRISLATGGPAGKGEKPTANAPKKQSHIRQARESGPKALPTKGPVADMLKKLFGGD